MRSESKFDLDGILTMMNENPTYKIRIHGHTNGGASGPILEVGESGNYFALAGAKEGYGSAKKLSQSRADAIKNYLAKQVWMRPACLRRPGAGKNLFTTSILIPPMPM